MSSFFTKLPVGKINEYSKVEKGPSRPPHWEMVFWWTRKPLSGVRAVIAAAALEDYDTQKFLNHLFFCDRKTKYYCDPTPQLVEKLRGKRLLDPFAGFGSIPLEAMRLGMKVTAVELLPTAYVFLKAVLEYPKKYPNIADEVKKAGEEVLRRLRQQLADLYDADAYIGTWEVKCPNCGRYTPLVSNWWIAKVKDGATYEHLAWFEWRDGKTEVYTFRNVRAKVADTEIEVAGKKYPIPRPNIDAKRETAKCLHCGVEINHRVVNGKVVKATKKEGEWYVDWAVRQWAETYRQYLQGQKSLNELKSAPARPTILVKIKDRQPEPATPADVDKLWEAAERIPKKDPDIPLEETPRYEGRALSSLIHWAAYFNPRQLLALISSVKAIRDLVDKEHIAVYMATALAKYADYNSVVTVWHSSFFMTGHTLSFRVSGLTWNWVDLSPWANSTGSLMRALNNVVEGVRFLAGILSRADGEVEIVLGDASSFNGGPYDLIVTDPPYADDVPYAELSDLYYVWVKRALSGVEGGRLVPRFLAEAFFDEFGIEIDTQWRHFARYEVSEDPQRLKYLGLGDEAYRGMLARTFKNLSRLTLGPMVVYYVAKKVDAWRDLIYALWEAAGLRLVAAHPVVTESEENVVARGKAAVLGGYVSMWMKREREQPLDVREGRRWLVEEVSRRLEERLRVANGFGRTTSWIYSYLAALEVLTSHYPVMDGGVRLGADEVVELAAVVALEALFRNVGVKLNREAMAYILLRILENERGVVDSDVLSHVERAVGVSHVELEKAGLLEVFESAGPRVAKRKTFKVLAPRADSAEELARVARLQREVPGLGCFRKFQLSFVAKSSVDCGPEEREEAKRVAEALVKLSRVGLLDEDDVDVKAARVIAGMEWWL